MIHRVLLVVLFGSACSKCSVQFRIKKFQGGEINVF